MIGALCKKVLAYANDNKLCRVCDIAEKEGKEPRPHDCRRNWFGSSKAMEPHMATEMVKEINREHPDCKVGTVVGDDDASSHAHLLKEVDEELDKLSDKNHVRKNNGKELIVLSNKHKRILTKNVINYLKKCFGYMLVQNKNNPQGIIDGLDAIVLHAFGDHSKCVEDSWCGFKKDPVNYRHSSLPNGQPLKGDNLKADLLKLFGSYKASADKLADLRSTQANESLNMLIARCAPKCQHYSGSESLGFRLACAMCLKNDGYTSIPKVSLHFHWAARVLNNTGLDIMQYNSTQIYSRVCVCII